MFGLNVIKIVRFRVRMPSTPALARIWLNLLRLRFYLLRLLIILLPLLALMVSLLVPPSPLAGRILVILGCLDLFLLPAALGSHRTRFLAQTFANLAVMTAWLSEGMLPAAVILVLGSLLSVAMQSLNNRAGAQGERPPIIPRTVEAALQTALTVLLAGLAYSGLNGVIPLQKITAEEILPLVILALVYGLVAEGLNYLVARWVHRQPYTWLWLPARRNDLLSSLLLLPMVIVLPVVLAGSGVPTFLLTVLVTIGLGFYQFQTYVHFYTSQHERQKSAELVRKLALVNQTAQNAMFRVDQELALQTACSTAASITQAEQAALFVTERDSETLSLVESVGFTEDEQARGLNLSLDLEDSFDTAPVVVNDAANFTGANPLAAFTRQLKVASFAVAPLLSGNALLGYLAVYHREHHEYTSSELELINILTDRIAAALDNAHLLDTLEFHAFEMTHLVHLSRISTASLKLEQVAADVTSVLRQMSAMDWAMIALLDDTHVLMNVVGFSGITTNSEVETFQYKLPQFEEVIAIRNQSIPRPRFIRNDEPGLSSPLRSYMEIHALRSLVIAPMVAHESTFGVVFLGTTAVRILTERESQLIEAAANQVATQIYNAQLYYETHNNLRHQLEQAALIRDIVERIASSRDFNATVQDMFEAAARTTGADVVLLALRTEADDMWTIEQGYHEGQAERRYGQRQLNEGIIGEVIRRGRRVLISVGLSDSSPDAVYPSWLALPLQRDQAIVGVLAVGSLQADFFKESQFDFLNNLGNHATISIQNERLLDELTYQVDVLTNLRGLSLSFPKVLDTHSVARKVIQTAMAIMHSHYAALFQTGKQWPSILEQVSRNGESLTTEQRAVVMDLAQQASSAHQMAVLTDVASARAAQLPDGIPYDFLVAAPIKRGDEVYHVLCLGFSEQQNLTELELNTLSLLAAQASVHLENADLNEEIHSVNSRLRAILDSTRDGVILLDDTGHIIEFNPAGERLMGINLAEHINENLASVLLRYSESSTEKQAGYSREELMKLARIARLGSQGITRREFSRVVNANQTMYIEEVGSPVFDDANHPIGRLMVLRDITEEKKLEEYRNEITGMAVHDLRAPLSAIINALQIASERIDTPNGIPVVKRTIEMGLSNADDMLTQVNTLLDIRKGREMTLDRTPTNIEEVIELARLRLAGSADKANIKIEVVIQPGLPAVNIDPVKIGRVFQNLIDNAIRFTPSGKIIRISVDLWGSNGKLLVRVADSGPGIPEKERSRVFEQYWQSKKNKPLRGSKGTGIGLAFCKLVLEAHGERIWVEPISPLPGACFAFTLPLN